jgi:hypothetical protein
MQHALLISLFVVYGLGAWGTINSIGKPRKPITHGQASVILVLNAAIVVFLTTLW